VEYDLVSAVIDEVVIPKPVLANSLQVTKLLIEDVICRRVVKGNRSDGIVQRHITRGAIANRKGEEHDS
jgi:hypothetical protein